MSSIFTSDPVLYSLIACFIVAELLSNVYRLIYSNSLSLVFYLASVVLGLFASLTFPIILQNLVILIGLVIFTIISSFLALIAPLDEQIIPEQESFTRLTEDFPVTTQKGFLFNRYYITYSPQISFITNLDKRSMFDVIKNNIGSIVISNKASTSFTFTTTELKFFNNKKFKLLSKVRDLDNIIHNLLFSEQ